MGKRNRKYIFLLASVLCASAAVLSLCLGNVRVSPGEVLAAIFGEDTPSGAIVRFVRVPRTLACLLSGAGLALSGAVLQRVLDNKLASPGIVGVNAGAGLGVTVCCALGLLSGWAVSLGAFLGSLLAVTLITLLSRRVGLSKTTVILSGVAMNSIFSALSESVTVLSPDVALLTMEFRVGGFSSVSYPRLLPAAVLILLGTAVLMTMGNELDAVALGDDIAHSIGLPVKRYRMIFLLLSALLAGASVSFSGLLGFVGLMVPHFVRRIVGSESRLSLPMTALAGAALVTFSDLAARLLFLPYELPVGILMAVLGGPAFVAVLLGKKEGWKHA